MKVGVAGSRDYPDLDKVRRFVDLLPVDTRVVSGGARGVDSAAEERAIERGMTVFSYRVQQVHWSPDRFEVQCHRWGMDGDHSGEYDGYVLVEEGFETFLDAAFFRNSIIADEKETDRVVAFWDGESHGTKDTIEKAGDRCVVVGV